MDAITESLQRRGRMSDFEWLGDSSILYKGKVCQLTEHDGYEVVNAMRRVDEEEARDCKRMKEEIKAEIMAGRKEE